MSQQRVNRGVEDIMLCAGDPQGMTVITKFHLNLKTKHRILHTGDSNIIIAFLVFMLRCEIVKFQLL